MSIVNPQLEQEHYGCVFCYTTREKAVACALEDHFPGLKATAVSQIKHKSEEGRKYTVEHILLPGYVFFSFSAEFSINPLLIQSVVRLLKNPEGTWELIGNDKQFAQFVFEHNGVFELSQARKINEKVTITSGPLKEMEGSIVKVDRHNRNGLVEFRFDDRVWKVWLAFEILE